MRSVITALAALLLTAGIARAELPAASAATVRQALSSGKPVVIDLGARTCIPCRKMAPILESLANMYRGRANILFIDVHEDQEAARNFRVQMIPTQIFFDSRGKEVKRHIGYLEQREIMQELQQLGVR